MATTFGEKSPWTEHSALLGSKVMQVSSGVNQGSNCLEMSYGHHIWWEESLTKALCIPGVKSHIGVQLGSSRGQLLSNALWPPNLGRNSWPECNALLGSKVMQGHPGSTRGQFVWKCPMATKFVGKNPSPKRNALLRSKVMKGQLGSSRGQFA